MQQLRGRTALVTGGGRGLGKAVARLFAANGAKVIIADIREDLAMQAADELLMEDGEVEGCLLDVGDSKQVNETVDRLFERHASIDVLINNAGTDVTLPIEKLSVDEWDRVLATNLRGPFLLSKKIMPNMIRRGEGTIINVASTAARRTWANASAYHASKWGLIGLSHALHVEGRRNNIKVCALISGGLRTPFIMERFPDVDPAVLQDPGNVAEAILFMVTRPLETVVPEMMILPMRETSWP